MVCASHNIFRTAKRMLTDNRSETPEDVLNVSPEVRERSVGHGIGTAPLRPIIAGQQRRRRWQTHCAPIVAQLSTGITRRPTRKLTLSTEWRQKRQHRQVVRASRRTGIHHLMNTLRRLHKGVLSSRRPVAGCRSKLQLLRSVALLTARPGLNTSLDAAVCVDGDHICAKPKREEVSSQ